MIFFIFSHLLPMKRIFLWVELCLSAQEAGKPTSRNGQAGVSTGQSELQEP